MFDLQPPLTALGMVDAFDPAKADLTGLSDSATARDLHVTAAVHKAFVEVNEEGTEAAAATGVAVGAASFTTPRKFRADHPFIFLIRDQETGAVLFLGRVTDPRG